MIGTEAISQTLAPFHIVPLRIDRPARSACRARGAGAKDRPPSGRDAGDELRRQLCKELLKQRCSATTVARRLSIHRRTLNRRLRSEGTGFRAIADEMRSAFAGHMLANTELPPAHIAAALDFSEPAAFTHAFRRWSGGVPPSVWRAQKFTCKAWRRASNLSRCRRPIGKRGSLKLFLSNRCASPPRGSLRAARGRSAPLAVGATPALAERRASEPLRPPFAIDWRARSRRSGSSAITRRRRLIASGLSSHPIDRRSASTSETAQSMSSSLAMICGSPPILAPDGQGLNREFSPAALTLVTPQGEPEREGAPIAAPARRTAQRR